MYFCDECDKYDEYKLLKFENRSCLMCLRLTGRDERFVLDIFDTKWSIIISL